MVDETGLEGRVWERDVKGKRKERREEKEKKKD